MRLGRAHKPFDDPEWLFEVKHDGFRALAYLEKDKCRLISRKGHEFSGFDPLREDIARNLRAADAVVDGEICCLGKDGRSVFHLLLFRKGLPHFYAFDLLWLDGKDLRKFPLIERKKMLNSILPHSPAQILFTPHLDGKGVQLFTAACDYDLEGIVAKRKISAYIDGADGVTDCWLKIKNPSYSQADGRHDLLASARKPPPPVF